VTASAADKKAKAILHNLLEVTSAATYKAWARIQNLASN